MLQKARSLLCVVLCASALSGAGCAARYPGGHDARLPSLLEEPAFLGDLERARLKRGGIALIAPSSGFSDESARAVRVLATALGASLPENAFSAGAVPYSANADTVRLELLAEALADPDIGIIWAALGGYGSSRLLDGLARLPVSDFPKKILIGYSDITFLHLYVQKLGWQTVHGSLFAELRGTSRDADNFRLLAALLAGNMDELRYGPLKPCNAAARTAGPIRSVVTGGNLTCLAAAVGTPWALDAAGKILLLEDVKEPGYKIDRMLTQLRDAGQLDGVRAVILGTFTAGDQFTEYALERFARDCGIPVFKTDIFGHGAKNYPLIFNAPAVLEGNTNGEDSFSLSIRASLLP